MSGISSKAAGKLENKIKYNGYEQQSHEFSDGSGLEWYDYKKRYYDNQIGRFFCVDGLADQFPYYSPYQFAGNEVPNAIDLDGLEPLRPNGPRYGQSNYFQEIRSYRQVNSYVPREASNYRTSATYIPNQAAGSAARPANIYEPFEPGSGQQFTGPFVTRGNTMGNAAVKMTERIDELREQIEKVTQTTDNVVVNNSMRSASAFNISWKTPEAEAAFKQMESDYQGKVSAINDKYKFSATPGAGASQGDWDKWLSDNKGVAQAKQVALIFLGASPMQQLIGGTTEVKGFKLTETKTYPLPELTQTKQ